MGTYIEVQNRINRDYLNRTDFGEITKRAIQNAIKTHETKRYWFNESSTTIAATAGNSFLQAPANLFHIDRISVPQNSFPSGLRRTTFDKIQEMNVGAPQGTPQHYAIRGDGVVLSQVPGSAYPMTIAYLHYLPLLVNDDDTNAWTTEAQNMIVHAATLDVLVGVLHVQDNDRVARHSQMLSQAMRELELRGAQRMGWRIQPTTF